MLSVNSQRRDKVHEKTYVNKGKDKNQMSWLLVYQRSKFTLLIYFRICMDLPNSSFL